VSALASIGIIPGVQSAVLGDASGALLDAVKTADGEARAAEAGFLVAAVAEVGEPLGLGALQRVVLAGQAGGSVLLLRGGRLLAARIEPARAIPAAERQLAAVFQGGG
jgi:hypothetical protein